MSIDNQAKQIDAEIIRSAVWKARSGCMELMRSEAKELGLTGVDEVLFVNRIIILLFVNQNNLMFRSVEKSLEQKLSVE